jgi:hypothetical protein
MKVAEVFQLLDVYNKDNAVAVIFSMGLFFLYVLVALMETYIVQQDYGVGTSIVTRVKFILTYTFGHYLFFMKITMLLIGLYLLLTIIRIVVVITFNLLAPTGTKSSFFATNAAFQGGIFEKVVYIMINNALWLMSFYVLENFMKIMVVTIPIIMLFASVSYAINMYHGDKLRQLSATEQAAALGTMHHEMYFTEVMFVIGAVAYLVYFWIIRTGIQ